MDGDILATVYRRLVQRYQSGLEGASARQRLQAVERAYEVLGDPHRRFRYDAELSDALFWWSLGVSLMVAFAFALPLNRWLIERGKGHAVVHAYHGQ